MKKINKRERGFSIIALILIILILFIGYVIYSSLMFTNTIESEVSYQN